MKAIPNIETGQQAKISNDYTDDDLQDDALAQIGPDAQRIIRDAQGKPDAEYCQPVLFRLPETQSHVRDVWRRRMSVIEIILPFLYARQRTFSLHTHIPIRRLKIQLIL